MKLSVIIPVYNSQTLTRCLAGMRASLRRPDEIIVVDDGSSAENRPAADPDIRLIRLGDGPCGPATARNRGAASATGDILVFIDCDVVPHPDATGLMQTVFEDDRDLGAVFGSYDDAVEGNTVSTFKNLLHHHVHQHSRGEAGTFWSGLGAVRRGAFDRVDGFDETIDCPNMEDIDLGMRLVRAGFRIRLQPRILGVHLKQWTLASWLKMDIFHRAIPWARIAARWGRMPDDLNAGPAGRLSAAAIWGGIASSFFLPGPWAWAVPVAGFACALAMHASLVRLFYRKGGFTRAFIQSLLLVFYLAYASLVFVSAFAYFKWISPLRH